MKEDSSRVLRGCMMAILGGLCWGFSGTCGQYLFSHYHVSTLWLTCVRMLSAGTLLVILALLRHPGEVRDILRRPKDMLLVTVYGVAGLLTCQYAYMTGISHSNAATTTVLQTLTVVLTMLVACLRSRRRPTWKESICVVLALFGVFMLATGGKVGQLVLSPQALFWGLSTAVSMTLYTLMGKAKRLAAWSLDVVMGLAMVIAGIFLNLLARSWTYPVDLPLQGWLLVAVIAFIGGALSFCLFMQGVRDAGPVRASILSVTEPVAAALLAFFWLGTRFTAADLIGFAAILATVFLLAKQE